MSESTVLARGNALLLAQMERLAKVTEAALEKEPQNTHVIPFSSSMESLHREIRESVAAAGIVPQCAEKCVPLADDDCQGLCDTLSLWARNANCNSNGKGPLYVEKLAGAQEVLGRLHIPYDIRLTADGDYYSAVSVGGHEKKVYVPQTKARTEDANAGNSEGVTLTEGQRRNLCELLAKWAAEVNIIGTQSSRYDMLFGLRSALNCLGISHNLLSGEDSQKYSMARVGKCVMEIENSIASDEAL